MRRGGAGRRRGLRALVALAALALAVGLAFSSGWVSRMLYPVRYASTIEGVAQRYDIDPYLVCAIIRCESGWDADAVSSAGAVGLMQVMPSTAQDLVDLGVVSSDLDPTDLTDPATNIEFGCAYLSYLEDNLDDTSQVVAAYNAGLGAVQGWLADGGTLPDDIEYSETRTYLERVLAALEAYRAAYPDGLGA